MQQIIAVFSGFLSSKSVFSYPFQNIFFLLFKLRYFWSLGFQIIVIYRENKTPSFLNTLNLKVLRNRISRIIRLWSLFCSILVYASLHFLLENIFLSFLPVMCQFDVIFINFITFAQSLSIQSLFIICVVVLTYEKQFLNVIKIWVRFLIKNILN